MLSRDTTTAASRPHVLYVSWGFPPMSGGGAYRTMSTANVLVESGFDVTVLTADEQAYIGLTAVDDTLLNGLDPRLRIHRIPFADPVLENDIRTWSRERAAAPAKWLQEFRDSTSFPEPRFGAWQSALLDAAEATHEENPIDLVIGSANPHVDLSVGPHLYQLHGIPHVIDHRDSWRLNWYDGTEAHTQDPRVAEAETEMVRTAHEVWFVNEAIADWHRELYPDHAHKIRVVSNGYDAQYAPTPVLAGPAPDEPLEFTYVGALSPVVPLVEFLEGWVEARRRDPDIARAHAKIYGPLRRGDDTTPRLLAAAARHGVQYCDAARKDELAAIYEHADVLLLILAGGSFVTSGKVFEYAASALPVVSVHEPDSGAGAVLLGYPLWDATEGMAADQVADALIRAAHTARTATAETRGHAARFAANLERHAQLRGPIEELRAFVTTPAEDVR